MKLSAALLVFMLCPVVAIGEETAATSGTPSPQDDFVNGHEFALATEAYGLKMVEDGIVSAQKEIQTQKEIGRVSGYIDKNAMYIAGRTIVDSKRVEAAHLLSYQNAGGKAKSVAAFMRLIQKCDVLGPQSAGHWDTPDGLWDKVDGVRRGFIEPSADIKDAITQMAKCL